MQSKDLLTMIREVRTILALLVVILGAVGVIDAVDQDGDRVVVNPTPPVAIIDNPAAPPATAVDGPDTDGKFDDALVLDTEAQEILENVTEENGPPREIDDPLRAPGDTGPVGVIEGPMASDEIPGCRTRFVGNFSSRNGVTPQVIVWHQTVSRERGQSSQDALTAYANSRSSGVSWAALIGRAKGLCTYTVPLLLNAWTQGNANRFSVGIEVEAVGDERSYVEGAGKRKLLSVTRHIAKRFGIPLRRGLVRNCQVIRPGIIMHRDLGECGGNHRDVCSSAVCSRDGIPEQASWKIGPLIRELAGPPALGPNRQRQCNALKHHRDRIRAGAKYRDQVIVNGYRRTRGHRMAYLRTKLQKAGVDQRRRCNH